MCGRSIFQFFSFFLVLNLIWGHISAMSVAPLTTTNISASVRVSMRTIKPSVAGVNQTWMHPSEIAKDCLNSQGKSMVEVCESRAEADYDPGRLHTTKSTTWETCCALYQELDCYLGNAALFCPNATRRALVTYTQKVVVFFQDSLCHTVIHLGWKQWCNNQSHEAMAEYHRKNNHQRLDFIKLPLANGPEKQCFEKLRGQIVPTTTLPTSASPSTSLLVATDHEQQCLNASLNRWDPERNKLDESDVLESCCAIYETLDCIQQQARSVCSTSDLQAMANYRTKSLTTLSGTICTKVPSTMAYKLCSGKGNAHTIPLSISLLVFTTLAIVFCHLLHLQHFCN